MAEELEFDYIVVGSGFGGSVSAFRLAQKGYSVAVLEAGRRWGAQDFPKTNWNIRKFLWLPSLGCHGIQRIDIFPEMMVLGGSGVGGGSLVYANVHYDPPDVFFNHPLLKALGGGKELRPYYSIARMMLGVTENPKLGEADRLLRETAAEYGRADTFRPTEVAVFFGEPEQQVADPYFMGEGPPRSGCNFCGGCMVGCRYDAKNTLDKNYLYFAEKLGARIFPETQVSAIRPLSDDGGEGYRLETRNPIRRGGGPRRVFRTKGLVLAAGVLGTQRLLWEMKTTGSLPRLSDALGLRVRTNSEVLAGVRAFSGKVDYSQGIAITSSVYPDEETHIEPVRYPAGSDLMGMLGTVLVDGGGALPRQLRFLLTILRHPLRFFKQLIPFGFARRTIILLVMQTLDNELAMVWKRRLFWPFSKSLTTRRGTGTAIPSHIPLANDFARRLGRRMPGQPGNAWGEVLMNIPTTAHILGGCGMATDPQSGVTDPKGRVFGYRNFLICDGSVIPANPGVNPSLSITAFSERIISFIPPKPGGKGVQWLKIEKEKGWEKFLNRTP